MKIGDELVLVVNRKGTEKEIKGVKKMSEIFEILMVVSFGASWPMNVLKSYRTRTTKGKSLSFLYLILFEFSLYWRKYTKHSPSQQIF